ncbi:hypothetical protein NKH34_12260 [Mesorhizobium sp. M1148]|uniref:hypothetical protein n=1 Tax=unclassified Mesorhizobium TaxID=325217 RepID=UPI003336AD2F
MVGSLLLADPTDHPAKSREPHGMFTALRAGLSWSSFQTIFHSGHASFHRCHSVWHLAEFPPQRDIGQSFRTSSITPLVMSHQPRRVALSQTKTMASFPDIVRTRVSPDMKTGLTSCKHLILLMFW